jgi:FkbM family methyltransferase
MRTVYPDEAEQRLKAEFFGARLGFFVDVGANDPQLGSQSFALEQAGWRGILVEPQPDLAEKLRQSRTARVFQVACSSRENAGKTMPLYLSGWHSSLDSQLVTTGVRPQGVTHVLIRTLDEILVEAGAPSDIDFLSIDVEGHEVEVLAGLDLSRWRVRLILVEDHVTSLSNHRLLTRRGYRTGLNGWYVPVEVAPRLGLFGWWSVVRKYYLGLPIRLLRERKRRWRDSIRASIGQWRQRD